MKDRPLSRGLRNTGVLLAVLFALSQTRCSAEPWTLWNNYVTHFVDAQGRVFDHQEGDRSTSEAQAYSMFFAVVANDRPHFDKLLEWTQNNLANGDLTARLPAWNWGKGLDGRWHALDANSASDADVWMSYALLQAGRLWREPRYTNMGLVMVKRIAATEVVELPQYGPVLIPGPQGFHPGPGRWVLNPSYPPLAVIEGLAKASPSGPWKKMAAGLPKFLAASAPAGFATDWASYSPQTGIVPSVLAAAHVANGPSIRPEPIGSYDAIRTYLWAGMADRETSGARASLNALHGMADYLQHQPTPPEKVTASGQVVSDGTSLGFSAALMPYLSAMGREAALNTQRQRLEAQRDPATGLYGRNPSYFDQNLALFGLGWTEKRFRFERDGSLQVKWE